MVDTKKRKKRTSALAAAFLFQYSLLIPLMLVMNSTLLVALSSVVIIIGMILVNNGVVRLNFGSLLLLVVLAGIMCFKHFIDGTTLSAPINFLMISLPPVIAFSYAIEWETFIQTSFVLSDINFLLLVAFPFLNRKVAYMRFGYGMLLTTTCSFIFLLSNTHAGRFRKAIEIVVFLLSLVEMTLYGSRGALLCFMVFSIMYLLLVRKTGKGMIVIATVSVLSIFNLDFLLDLMTKLVELFGVRSYALKKIKLMISSGLEASASGRYSLYSQAIENIKRSPLIGNYMETSDSGNLYVHNLFLQVGVDMGVVAMVITVLFIVYVLALITRKTVKMELRVALCLLFCVSCGRLMISSTLWERPEFWILTAVVISQRRERLVKVESSVNLGDTKNEQE